MIYCIIIGILFYILQYIMLCVYTLLWFTDRELLSAGRSYRPIIIYMCLLLYGHTIDDIGTETDIRHVICISFTVDVVVGREGRKDRHKLFKFWIQERKIFIFVFFSKRNFHFTRGSRTVREHALDVLNLTTIRSPPSLSVRRQHYFQHISTYLYILKLFRFAIFFFFVYTNTFLPHVPIPQKTYFFKLI